MSATESRIRARGCPHPPLSISQPRHRHRRAYRQLRRDPLGLFLDMQRAQGDLAQAKLGRRDLFLVSHPELIHKVLVSGAREFARETFTYKSLRKKYWFPRRGGLVGNTDLEAHLEGRRILQPAFRRARIDAHWGDLLASARATSRKWSGGEALDILYALRGLVLEMSARVTFGATLDLPTEQLLERFRSLLSRGRVSSPLREATMLLRLRPLIRLAADYDAVLSSVEELFARRQEAPDPAGDDVVSLLSRHAGAAGISTRQAAMEATGMLFADVDSTAIGAAWVLYGLARDPNAQDRVRQELADVPQRGSGPPNLPFTQAVIDETLRLYPPSWGIARSALTDQEVGGRRVPAGATVWVSPFLIHRDARWWDDPERFVPMRWLDKSDDSRPALTFLPFSAGLHKCPGYELAVGELMAVTVAIVGQFELSPVTDEEAVPVARSSLQPRDPLLLRFEPRR